MSGLEDLHDFYRRRVPGGFNRTLEAQQRLVETSDDPRAQARQARLLEEMLAVRAVIRVRVLSGDGLHVQDLVIELGRMAASEPSDRSPFLTLDHDIEAFPRLEAQCGDSILGFLGALTGLGNDMKLTAQRVQSLRDLGGGLVFELRGEKGFELRAHFGAGEPDPKPRTAIRLHQEVFERLREGSLDAQTAFLSGEVEVEGSMKMAIKLALAALSPD